MPDERAKRAAEKCCDLPVRDWTTKQLSAVIAAEYEGVIYAEGKMRAGVVVANRTNDSRQKRIKALEQQVSELKDVLFRARCWVRLSPQHSFWRDFGMVMGDYEPSEEKVR